MTEIRRPLREIVIDMDDDGPGSDNRSPNQALVAPSTKPEHPTVRPYITYGLLAAFGLQVVAAMAVVLIPWSAVAYPEHLDAMKDIFAIVFVPTVTLLGSAIGFYFASNV